MKSHLETCKNRFIDYLEKYNPLNGKENVSLVQVYKKFIIKEKTIYNVLN